MEQASERALRTAKELWGTGWTPEVVARAPGRLELLGNHVDYNGGKVLAAAIDRDVVCLAGSGESHVIIVRFADVDEARTELDPSSLSDWRNPRNTIAPVDYVRGVIATGLARQTALRAPAGIAIAGDVPIGFGLSSSAALCVALTLALHWPAPAGRELVLRAQEAEHRAGTPCGTMDQSASVGGNVILFNSADVSWEAIAPDLGDYAFAVADSGVSRSLGASSYPKRVEESREALAIVNAALGEVFVSLSDIPLEDLKRVDGLPDGRLPAYLKRRVRHVVTERERVAAGLEAMRRADWRTFGALMTASGISSATDYEISHPRVEQIVAIARTHPGVAGARMMGGGEGGTALILLERAAVNALRESLDARYYQTHGMSTADAVRLFQFADGASLRSYTAG